MSVARDGRFIMLKPTGESEQLTVHVDWPQSLSETQARVRA